MSANPSLIRHEIFVALTNSLTTIQSVNGWENHMSHKTHLYLTAIIFAAVFGVKYSAPANSASANKTEKPVGSTSLVGKPCATGEGDDKSVVGVTTLDLDKTGIIGCFLKNAGSSEAVWKAGFPVIPETSQRRYTFTYDQIWVVPEGVRSANVTMAGGGGSGLGWRISSAYITGHSGGYLFSHPITVTPGEELTIIVGRGGKGYAPVRTSTPANPGPPYYVYAPPTGDDGLGGHPGTSSMIISPERGTLLECAGGSGAYSGGLDSMDKGTLIVGPQNGATFGSGNPPLTSPNRIANSPYARE
jgi:hypothetical protein